MQTQIETTNVPPRLHIVPSLSTELRHSTAKAHQSAEGASFIKSLLLGRCSENAYIHYLWALRKIYGTLERALTENKNDMYVSRVYLPELFRSDALNSDFQSWNPSAEVEATQLLNDAVQAYTGTIQNISETKPGLLVAHAYVRYLGDLAGGQTVGKQVARHFAGDKSLEFYHYDFEDIDAMKTLYRARLDEIGTLPGVNISEICTEAQSAFRLNENVFSALSEIS